MLAGSTGERGCELVFRPVRRDAIVSASHASGGGSSDCRASAALSPSGSAQAWRFWRPGSRRRTDRRPRRFGDILKRAGLVEPARRRRPPLDQPRRAIAAEAANDEWAADFKGWFRTKDQQRIDPLTIADSHARFLIETRITGQTVEGARAVRARLYDLRPAPGDPLRQRRAVWLARGGRSDAAFGVVAQARRRTAFHSARLAAGERAP
jgi:transposase InsO family protein